MTTVTKNLFLRFIYISFMRMGILFASLPGARRGQKTVMDSLEMELGMKVSHGVCAGN